MSKGGRPGKETDRHRKEAGAISKGGRPIKKGGRSTSEGVSTIGKGGRAISKAVRPISKAGRAMREKTQKNNLRQLNITITSKNCNHNIETAKSHKYQARLQLKTHHNITKQYKI